MNILTKMLNDLNIDSDILDANENYFVSTHLTYFNYRHLMHLMRVIEFVCNPVDINRTVTHTQMQFNG